MAGPQGLDENRMRRQNAAGNAGARKAQAESIGRSRIHEAIAQARASLAEPSRPFTPADPGRHLLRGRGGSFDGSRPSSAFPSRGNFAEAGGSPDSAAMRMFGEASLGPVVL